MDSCPFCEFNVSSFANYFSVDCPLFSAHSVQAFCTHTSWPQSRTGGLFLERFEEGGAYFARASTSIHKPVSATGCLLRNLSVGRQLPRSSDVALHGRRCRRAVQVVIESSPRITPCFVRNCRRRSAALLLDPYAKPVCKLPRSFSWRPQTP